MLVPLSLLKKYVPVSLSPAELAHALTMAGTEIGEVSEVGAGWERDKVLVGHVLSVDPHPNADRLTVPTVDLGGETKTVVCGAPNVAAGQKIAFAHEGARLYSYRSKRVEPLKAAKIRGVLSAGMVCSALELGLGEDHDGILVLDDDAPDRDAAGRRSRRRRPRRGGHAQPAGLPVHPRRRPRGRGHHWREGHRAGPVVPGGRRPDRGPGQDRDRRPRPVRPIHGQPDRGGEGRRVPEVAPGRPGASGPAADQQHRRRDELRHDGVRPAAARLRPRHDRGAHGRRQSRAAGRVARDPGRRDEDAAAADAGHRRSPPRHRAGGRHRRRRDRRDRGHGEHPARVGQLRRDQHAQDGVRPADKLGGGVPVRARDQGRARAPGAEARHEADPGGRGRHGRPRHHGRPSRPAAHAGRLHIPAPAQAVARRRLRHGRGRESARLTRIRARRDVRGRAGRGARDEGALLALRRRDRGRPGRGGRPDRRLRQHPDYDAVDPDPSPRAQSPEDDPGRR